MNSSSCNNQAIASYFLENDIDNHSCSNNNISSSTKPNLLSSSAYTNFFINTFPNSPPQYFYSAEFDLSESFDLQHICHHLFSDNNPHTTTTSTPMEMETHNNNNPHDHLFASASPTVVLQPKPEAKVLSSSTNRSSKKDRHSKIRTANGLRDRRMRLSLDVAKRFFKLQDVLGYDKASQTVNWLLKSSIVAIRDLERERERRLGLKNYSSSTTNSDRKGEQVEGVGLDALSGTWENSSVVVEVKKGKKMKAKSAARATVEKESREKARERARARTSQKRRLLGDITMSDQDSMVQLESSNGDMFAPAPWYPSHLGEIQFPRKPWGT